MTSQLQLNTTKPEELSAIAELEQGEAREFIIPYSIGRHRKEFRKPDAIYKSILTDDEWIGFVILVLDPDSRSLEFRRIVISKPGHGYGKRVLPMIDQICRNELSRNRIWLDVFETNVRARSLYEKCGYESFGTSEYQDRKLLLYEKVLMSGSL